MHWRFISPRDWQAIAIVISLMLVLAFSVLWLIPSIERTNSGFGPDWVCTQHALSEPTCIKKVPRAGNGRSQEAPQP